jgi:L-seryl-tRNA(Ser) seleniumtransferase
MTSRTHELLRSLPAVDRVLADPRAVDWQERYPRPVVVAAVQAAIDHARARILDGAPAIPDLAALLDRAEALIAARTTPSLRRVINATGVVLHTGLGRAPLSAEAMAAVAECAAGYCNLEYDLATGTRGRRVDHVAALLCELTGAEAATVVNNNAAATLIILNTVANGAEVIVSRGQLVEIGGSYRLPEMMTASGAVLREVGTTNRTRLADYERAIGDRTAALLRVHTSNYRVVGFTQEVDIAELVALGRRHDLPVIDDLGSGALADLDALGLPHEPLVRTSITAGADLVCFSGDKLLGGPQAGIILGSADLVRRIEANPLMRTYRVDKMVLAALEATLRAYHDPQHATDTVPGLSLLSTPIDVLDRRAQELASRVREQTTNESFEIIADRSVAGGGSLPAEELETRCLAWKPTAQSVDELLTRLRAGDPPVVARAKAGCLLFDLRTVFDHDIQELADVITRAANAQSEPES